MHDLRSVLAIIDPAATRHPALERAAELCRATGAALRLEAIVHDPRYAPELFNWKDGPRIEERDRLTREIEGYVEGLAEDVALDEVAFGARWDHPFAAAVLAAVAELRPELLLFQPRDLENGRLAGSEWRLLSRCPVPVWLARSAHWPASPEVVAAVDPEPGAAAGIDRGIVAAADAVCSALGGRLTLLHARGALPGAALAPSRSGASEAEASAARRERLEALAADLRSGSATLELPAGDAADAIDAVVRQRAVDLLVMGILARSRLAEVLIGSTARRVVPASGCDVLTVAAGATR